MSDQIFFFFTANPCNSRLIPVHRFSVLIVKWDCDRFWLQLKTNGRLLVYSSIPHLVCVFLARPRCPLKIWFSAAKEQDSVSRVCLMCGVIYWMYSTTSALSPDWWVVCLRLYSRDLACLWSSVLMKSAVFGHGRVSAFLQIVSWVSGFSAFRLYIQLSNKYLL